MKLSLGEGRPVEILEVDPEGPAARAEVAVGDVILRINGVDTKDMMKPLEWGGGVRGRTLDPAAILATPGSAVKLTLKRGEREFEVSLVTIE